MLLLLKAIILHCQNEIKNERTINSIYHLLKGKQSIQTIQDAHLYQLGHFYSLHKYLSKPLFDDTINELLRLKYLDQVDASFFITEPGIQFLESVKLNDYYWDGMKYRQIDRLFFQRLLLFIQVWTNVIIRNRHYIPIVDEVEVLNWIKRFYQTNQDEPKRKLEQLYHELVSLFSQLPSLYPEMFVRQITTATSIGLTYEQLANYFNKSITDIYLLHINYVHFILKNVTNNDERYPLLSVFVKDLTDFKQEKTVTNSANKTLYYISQGFTPEQIAEKRRLKINTIYDHIVEIALQDDNFPIHEFVSERALEEIYLAVRKLKSLKLKEIKHEVSESISYFHIRLALTKLFRINGE